MIRLAIAIAELHAATCLLDTIMSESSSDDKTILNLTQHEIKKAALNRINKALEHLKRIK